MVICVLHLAGCKSDPYMPEVAKVNFPKLTSDPDAHQAINMANDPADFIGRLTVDLYFPNSVIPNEAILVVAKNGTYNNVKEMQPITQYPTVVEITGAKLIELFGDIALNDRFEIGLNAKYSGVDHKAFYSDGRRAYSAGMMSFPGASPILTYRATNP